MELFVPDRKPHEVVELMARLRAVGLGGRDAAYLASVRPPEETGSPEMAMFLKEFELMVDISARTSAAALIGLGSLPEVPGTA